MIGSPAVVQKQRPHLSLLEDGRHLKCLQMKTCGRPLRRLLSIRCSKQGSQLPSHFITLCIRKVCKYPVVLTASSSVAQLSNRFNCQYPTVLASMHVHSLSQKNNMFGLIITRCLHCNAEASIIPLLAWLSQVTAVMGIPYTTGSLCNKCYPDPDDWTSTPYNTRQHWPTCGVLQYNRNIDNIYERFQEPKSA